MNQLLKDKEKYIHRGFLLLASFLGTYGTSYVCGLVVGTQFSNGIISVAAFVASYIMINLAWEQMAMLDNIRAKKRRLIYSFGLSVFFCVLFIWGYQLKANGYTDPGVKGKGITLIRAMCLSLVVWPFANYFFGWLDRLSATKEKKVDKKPWKSKYVFLLSWLTVFLCWVPVFLAYYPAIMTYDFHRQSIEAARGFIWFNSYQPLAHTWLIWLFFNIGQALGGYQTGMALYSIFQMLVFSVACAYSCSVIYRLVKSKVLVIITVLFFGVFPIVSVLSVAVTKDILFTAFFLVFVCLFIERTCLSDSKKQKTMDVLWVLDGVVMILFRNNAIYAVALFALCYLVVGKRKQKLKIIVMCILLIVVGKLALEGVQAWIGTEGRGSKVEMFSVPIQQFARVGKLHGHEMDEECYRLVTTYVAQEFWEDYYPPISDSVKASVGAYTFDQTWKNHYLDMFSAWIKVGMKYPNTYIDAFLELTAGYWFFDDVTWAEVLGYGTDGRFGAVYTFTSSVSDAIPEGIAHESKFPALEKGLEEIVSGNCFYYWPIISILFKPALYCWILLLSMIAYIYTKQIDKLSIVLIPVVYLLTLYLGPVVQIRYVLPFIVLTPVLIGVLLTDKLKDKNS